MQRRRYLIEWLLWKTDENAEVPVNVIEIPTRRLSVLVIGRYVWKLEPCKLTDRANEVLHEHCPASVTHAHPRCYHAWQCGRLWIPSPIHNKPKHSPKNCITKVECTPPPPNQSLKSICHRQGKGFSTGVNLSQAVLLSAFDGGVKPIRLVFFRCDDASIKLVFFWYCFCYSFYDLLGLCWKLWCHFTWDLK